MCTLRNSICLEVNSQGTFGKYVNVREFNRQNFKSIEIYIFGIVKLCSFTKKAELPNQGHALGNYPFISPFFNLKKTFFCNLYENKARHRPFFN